MCGIVGIFNLNGEPVSQVVLRKMTDSIEHRGPDGEGFYIDSFVGLGHRRLAIIDLSPAGNQPMSNEDGNIVITYNGMIYNFQELRTELEASGHRFRSNTDTEVIVHAYEQWSKKCVERFNGMFAFAIWDFKRKKVFFARDRYGIKPLYYYHQNHKFIFASEIKAILEDGEVQRGVDLKALKEYFTFQNIYSDRTLLKGIRLLPPGHHMELDINSGDLSIQQYWDFDFSSPLSPDEMSIDECAKLLRMLFEQAVTRQLVSDVPLGSYLSGGMDSGSIVAVASRKIPRLMTFTGGFEMSLAKDIEGSFDERGSAELMASYFSTEHYERIMHSGDMAYILPKLVRHLEDLRLGMSWADYYVSKMVSKLVKVVLSGAGGDELFGGYPWRYKHALAAKNGIDFLETYYRYWQRLIPDSEKSEFFSDSVWKEINGYSTFEIFKTTLTSISEEADVGIGVSFGSILNRVFYFETKTFLHGLFIVLDKISMSNSLETRVPFLDNDLVDFAMKIPPVYKVDVSNDAAKYADNSGKKILRRAMEGLIPKNILDRRKQGFSPPDGSWYRGPTMGYIKEVLFDDGALTREYFRSEYIKKIIEEHEQGEVNHRLLIWSLLNFEWWCRQFLH